MATVHPSRMALVPQDPKEVYPNRDRQRSRTPPPRQSRRRSPSPPHIEERRHGRDNIVERDDERYGGRDQERDGRRERARADDYFDGGRGDDRRGRRSRSRSVDRERDREREEKREREKPRRASPEYTEYRKPSPSRNQDSQARAPWRQEENMYPNRRDRPPHVGYGGGGADFMDSRRLERDSKTANVWPPSPKAPTRSSRSPDPKRRKKSRKHRRDPSTELSSTDSEEERRRKERKERKRAKKEKEKEKRRHRSRDRSPLKYSDEEDDRRDRRTRHRTRDRDEIEEKDRRRDKDSRGPSRTKSPEPARPPSSDAEMDDVEWVEKPSATTLIVPASPTKTGPGAMAPPAVPASASTTHAQVADEDSDEDVGPQPLTKVTSSKKIDERQYGGALLRGEGSAMAAFLKDGTDVRIPRRGEIGLSSNEIASFESVGYVMSGSRHRRMNAVRMRKENQVISAEEKRGILKLQQEERQRRETILREEFQSLVDEKLKDQRKP